MELKTADELLRTLRTHDLLRPEQLAALPDTCTDARDLARELHRRNWLTRFQLAMVLHGRADQLTLGQYRLLDRLGAGGMGEVYKATQQRLQRVVALKVVKPELLKNPNVARRFRREVQAAGKLSHLNIVQVFDAESAGEVHFLVEAHIMGAFVLGHMPA